jgi:acyl-CoA thioesterase
MTTFDRATAIEPVSEDTFRGQISDQFWVQAGPNGGYLTALALRAAMARVDEPARLPRSVHVRFLSPPRAEACELHTQVVRRGKAMTTIAVRMQQAGKAAPRRRRSSKASRCRR